MPSLIQFLNQRLWQAATNDAGSTGCRSIIHFWIFTSIVASLLSTPIAYSQGLVGPCDILAKSGTPCVAAHSVTRKMRADYNGNAFQLYRIGDRRTLEVGFLPDGQVDTSPIRAFATSTVRWSIIYDQMGTPSLGNNLPVLDVPGPFGDLTYQEVTLGNGKRVPIINGNAAFNNRANTVNMPTGNASTTEYMVVKNEPAIFPYLVGGYGNVEATIADTGNGHMFELAFTQSGETVGSGAGPWIGADLENGVWLYGPSYTAARVTGLIKWNGSQWTVRSAPSTASSFTTIHGPTSLPPRYGSQLHMEGGLALGVGGDMSAGMIRFFEGAIIKGATDDATDDAVQANIHGFYGP